MSNPRPPMLILMPDQLRADTMGCAGHPLIQTPNMDRLAGEGVRFSNAHTVCPICMPARASFISGLYPHNHHMWTNRGEMPRDDETCFHHLQAAGYFTAHVGKSHYYVHGDFHMRDREDYMHTRGLDYVHETTGPWATVRTDSYMTDRWEKLGLLQAFREDYRKRRATNQEGKIAVWPSPLPEEEFMDSYIGRQAVKFVEEYEEDKSVCLFVGFGGPHEPWDAPGRYATRYDPARTPPAIPSNKLQLWNPQRTSTHEELSGNPALSEDEIQRVRANYYGKVSLIDHWFGEILSAFERKGWEDALVVFWSDHGEMAGDHGRLHKSVFYDASVHVPLILRWPGHIEAGDTRDALTVTIDVVPTLVETIGAEPSPRCFGQSLWPVLENPEHRHRDAVFSEIVTAGHKDIMVRTEQYKYAMDDTGSGYLLYDVVDDPTEAVNLIGRSDMRPVERELRERILAFLTGTQHHL